MEDNKLNQDFLYFQIIDWVDLDNNGQYTVLIFGRDQQGKSITIQVKDFKPYFYIKPKYQSDIEDLREKLNKKHKKDILNSDKKFITKKIFDYQQQTKKEFYYYNDQKYKFFKITTQTKSYKQQAKNILQNIYKNDKNSDKEILFYEINGDPYLKLIHERDINPAGWIKIEKTKLNNPNQKDIPTSTQLNHIVSYLDIHKHDCLQISPIKISAFDLECRPLKGVGFPKASKGYQIGQSIFNKVFENNKKDFDQIKNKLINFLIKELIQNQNDSQKFIDYKANIQEQINIFKSVFEDYQQQYNNDMDGFNTIRIKEDIIFKLIQKFQKFKFWDKQFQGDPIIQIGLTTSIHGQNINNTQKIIFSLGSCKIENNEQNITIFQFQKEIDLIKEFCNQIDEIDPDIITGYNTSGFDNQYLYQRAQELRITYVLKKMSRLNRLAWKNDQINEQSMHDKQDKFIIYDIRELKSSALGQNELKYIQTYGRIQIDLMKQIMRDHQLESYKLDYVSHYFFGGNKIDLDAQKMFDIYIKGSKSRGQIAIYCIKDCVLCNQLIQNQDIINKEIAMANVCSVPLSYIFHRGQGIKIYSLLLKQTTQQDYLIKDHGKQRDLAKKDKKNKKNKIQELTDQENQLDEFDMQTIQDGDLNYNEDGKYQGATVLDPKTGIYNNEMISVFDYASLYPSSMIDYNISHDTLLYNPDIDNLDPNLEYSDPIIVDCEIITKKVIVKDNKIEEIEHKEIEKQTYIFIKNTKKQGIIPQILQHLLKQRKNTKLIMSTEKDQVKKKILDGQQLAYKITANSLYGQCGAKTSQIYLPELARATTAVGRLMLQKAINFAQSRYNAKIIYGDTDSCFIIISEEHYLSKNQEYTLQEKIQLLFNQGYKIQNEYQKTISIYQKLEFEKVLFPLILFAKKRYYGYCYENPNNRKLISPGTISKRRDSAQIAKLMFENTIDILMLRQINLEQDYFLKSIKNIQEEVVRIMTKEYNKDYFKLYRNYNGGNYKSDNLPHVQVVKRMLDQGEKVEANERIEFYYVKIDNETEEKRQYQKSVSSSELDQIIQKNQGDIDYINYIEKQIMNPLISIYALDVNKLIQYLTQNPQLFTQLYNMTIDKIQLDRKEKYKNQTDLEIQLKINKRIKILNEEIVQLLIFNPVLPDLKLPGLSEFKYILKQFKLPNTLNKTNFLQQIVKVYH